MTLVYVEHLYAVERRLASTAELFYHVSVRQAVTGHVTRSGAISCSPRVPPGQTARQN